MAVLDSATRFFGSEAIQDPYPLYERMHAEAPMHRIGDSVFYAVCGWDAVHEAIERVEDFSSNLTATMVFHEDGTVTPFDMGAPGAPMHALATADDPVHAVHRKILLPHLSAKRIRIIEEFATQTADRLWDENLSDGRIEWMSAIANRLPMMVVCRLLGLPDDDVDKLIRLATPPPHCWTGSSPPNSSSRPAWPPSNCPATCWSISKRQARSRNPA